MKNSKLLTLGLYSLSFACLVMGLYIFANSIFQILAEFNYLIGPLGDESFDTARVIYPIIEGEASFSKIFTLFADHRVVIERLFFLMDFYFAQSIGFLHSYRLVFFSGSSWLLFVYVINKEKTLPLYVKILLLGLGAAFIFPTVTLINYGSPILMTWPIIIFLAFLSFLTIIHFTESIAENKPTANSFFVLTMLWVTLAIFTFNIGFLIWPIIAIVMVKKEVPKKYLLLWSVFIAIMIYIYFGHEAHLGNPHSYKHFIKHPIRGFLYYSRIMSLIMIPSASTLATIGTIFIGIISLILPIYYLRRLLQLKKWQFTDAFVFCGLMFSFISLLIITIMRSGVKAEYVAIGGRFLTAAFIFYLFLIYSIFKIHYDYFKANHFSLFSFNLSVFLFMALFFYPANMASYFNLANVNKYFISIATDVPFNPPFKDYAAKYEANTDINHMIYNNEIQKKFKKGIYAIFNTKTLNTAYNLAPIPACAQLNTVTKTDDLRPLGNPLVVMDVQIPKKLTTSHFQSIFLLALSGADNKIVGYGIPKLSSQKLTWENLFNKKEYTWQLAINTALAKTSIISLLIIDQSQEPLCLLNPYSIA